MSVTSRSDTAKQTIPAGPLTDWVKLKFGGVTEFPTEAGRTLVVAWVSSDAFPHKAAAEQLRDALIAAQRGSTGWTALVEESLKFLLRPPLIRFRADRHMPGAGGDWTERDVRNAPLISDAGLVYMAEFDCDEGELVSVEVGKDPDRAVDLNFREIKIITLVPQIDYR